MLGPYRAVLSLPGALAFSASGLLARAEIAMVGLGCVLLVESTTGSYALGGAVAAAYGLSHAAVSPLLARTVDRWGQAAVLRPAVAVHAVALLALAALGTAGAAPALLFVVAVLAGATEVGAGSLVRARWAGLLAGTPRLQTAFALESVLDELVFIVGPVLITLLATTVHPASGLLLGAATAIAGALLLAAQRSTQPPIRLGNPALDRSRGSRSALAAPGMVVIVLVFLAAGGIFGAAEVAVVATTEEAGAPAAAGAVLAIWALGSLVSGLAYGAITWRGALVPRFVGLTVLLALLSLPIALAAPIPVLAVAFLVAGVAIAPTISTGAALVESIVPPARLTEGLAWTNTALSITYSLGAAFAGAVADAAGGHAALLVPVGCAVAAAVTALLGLPRLLAGTRVRAPA